MIKFKQVSKVYGDCTADYEVILDKQYTVREFVSFVLSQKDEWAQSKSMTLIKVGWTTMSMNIDTVI